MSVEQTVDRHFVEALAKRDTDINVHLLTLFNLVQELGAKVVVELGAGQSTYALLAAVKETSGSLYSHDLDPLAHIRDWPDGKGLLEKEPRYFFVPGNDILTIRDWHGEIDLLFIDTSHQYHHTLKELRLWEPHVRVEGKIVMHDTYHKIGHAVDCRKALNTFLKDNLERFSVVHNEDRGGLSILTKLK